MKPFNQLREYQVLRWLLQPQLLAADAQPMLTPNASVSTARSPGTPTAKTPLARGGDDGAQEALEGLRSIQSAAGNLEASSFAAPTRVSMV